MRLKFVGRRTKSLVDGCHLYGKYPSDLIDEYGYEFAG
jgi:hypothetical protein